MLFKKDKRKEIYEPDDGRSYADMNVEGMPWYRPENRDGETKGEKVELTKEETKSFMWGTLKAACLIALIFGGVYFLFILFLDVVVFGN